MSDAPRPDEATPYDLRTATQQEADDLAALRLELQRMDDALAYANRRMDEITRATMTDIGGHGHRLAALEGETAALKVHVKAHAAAIERIADGVQLLLLRGGGQ